MKYHIGLISKLLGLSAGGIRLYERGGIVRSQREGDGGYRFYERPDIVSLMLAMSYRGCGFTLGEAEALVNTDDPDFVAESLRRREEKLEAEIRRKKLILERMRENRRMIENAPSEFGMVELRERPAFYRLEFMRGGDLILRPEDYSLFRKWRELSPFVFPSLRGNWRSFSAKGSTKTSRASASWKATRSCSARSVSPGAAYITRHAHASAPSCVSKGASRSYRPPTWSL